MSRNNRCILNIKYTLCIIIGLNFFTILFGQAGNVPVQSLPQFPGPFSIDGFLQRQGVAGDWLPGPGGANNVIFTGDGTPLVPLALRIVDKYYSTSDEVFSKGSLQDDPNTMKWALRKAQGKTDMNNILFFIALNPNDNHVWVVLGADRRTTGNNCSIDFEFLQNQVFMIGDINSSSHGGFFSTGPHGGRTVGDLIISIKFLNQGDNFATVEFLQWQPGANPGEYRYFFIAPPPGTAFAAFNTTPISVPFGAFGTTTYPPGTFAEAAVDLTAGFIKSIWVKSKSNDNFDDFNLPFQLSSSGYPITITATFYDLYHAQLDVDISPFNPSDFNFHWSPVGAYNGTAIDPTVTGTLNDYNIQNPIFTADTNYNCISYIYKLRVTRKDNGELAAETYVVINSPCKIGKPINPDEMNQGEAIAEETFNDEDMISVFPNPARSASAITLRGDNGSKDIALIDINGAIIQQWSGTNGNSLKLKDVANGLYLLRITSKKTGNTITKKLIIEN